MQTISNYAQSVSESLRKRSVSTWERLVLTLPSDGSLLAVHVEADEPYGGLRFVDLLGRIPIKIMVMAYASLGAFCAAFPELANAFKGLYAIFKTLGPDARAFTLSALLFYFLVFPILCLLVSLSGVMVVIRQSPHSVL